MSKTCSATSARRKQVPEKRSDRVRALRGGVPAHRPVAPGLGLHAFPQRPRHPAFQARKPCVADQQCAGRRFRLAARRVEASAGPLAVQGLAGNPAAAKLSRESQYFFVNGRYVRYKVLQHAVRAAYADVLHGERHPAYAFVSRFAAARRGRERASGENRGALSRQRLDPPACGCARWRAQATAAPPKPRCRTPRLRSLPPTCGAAVGDGGWRKTSPCSKAASGWPRRLQPITASPYAAANSGAAQYAAEAAAAYAPAQMPDRESPLGQAGAAARHLHPGAKPCRLVLVDMHAAHERIRTKSDLDTRAIASQPLLTSVTFAAEAPEVEAAEEHAASLQALGFEVVPLSPTSSGGTRRGAGAAGRCGTPSCWRATCCASWANSAAARR